MRLSEEERDRWIDLYARLRWQGWSPQMRLKDQAGDLMKWVRLGEKKR